MSTLALVLARHAAFQGAAVALRQGGVDLSYAALWQRVLAADKRLRAAGVGPGDRVAWLGLNDPAQVVLMGALSRRGAMLLPLNYRLAPAEWQRLLLDAAPRLLVADAAWHEAAAELSRASGVALLAAAEAFPPIEPASPAAAEGARAAAAAGDDHARGEGRPDAPLLLVYTSGTTGTPRGALHAEQALLWNGVISAHAHGLVPQDRVLGILPMFHVGGLCIQLLPALHAGATVLLHPRYEPGAWLRDVAAERATLSLMVPATLKAAIEHADFAATDLSSLRLLMAGSSVVPRPLIEAFHARGVPVGQVYGATETGPVSIYLRADEALRHVGAAGRAGLHVEVALRDAHGRDLPPGAEGEICLRAPNLMSGYWNPAASASASSGRPAVAKGEGLRDGWFHSGDLARQDAHGCYWVVGRSKDLIISGGENIHPAEVEGVLLECPAIAEAAVLGRPDAHWGEVVVAAVVARAGHALDEAAVLAWLDGRLARFKRPRQVVLLDALPRTALGKVQKGELAARLRGASTAS